MYFGCERVTYTRGRGIGFKESEKLLRRVGLCCPFREARATIRFTCPKGAGGFLITMIRFSKTFSSALCILIFLALGSESVCAWEPRAPSARPSAQKNEEKKKRKKNKKENAKDGQKKGPPQNGQPDSNGSTPARPSGAVENIEIVSDSQGKVGELYLYEGYVNVTLEDARLQADRVTLNQTTGDLVAEGNVIFDQGTDQRVTARRAEINSFERKGVFWDSTGFTNRTQTGEYIFFTADRVERTGPDTYELYGATVTACEDVVPKWSFSAERAALKMNDRLKLYKSLFRVKDVPVFVLPYAWIPATRAERQSGFLLPTTGTSNQKGRTFKTAYYQTLGPSADVTIRSDLYTARGLGLGAEFRAQTDEKSFIRLGAFTVKDRLFGEDGEDQGGTAFVAEAVQYLPRGWLAVGNVSFVTSLPFRQVFSDDISQVIDPRRESRFYINNNARDFSFNFLASNETTTLFRPTRDPEAPPNEGTNFDVKIRTAPELSLTVYPRRIKESLPIYFSFDSSIGAMKREETVDGVSVLTTPSAVQRFDFQPKITVPLATLGGFAITPSLAVRQTLYSSSLDPTVEAFDPDRFTLSPDDPRLDPANGAAKPGLRLFTREDFDPIIPEDLSRRYAELAVDIRPPSLEKVFLDEGGARRFKHVIEPYLTYRVIGGIGDEFDKIIRFDERDAVANTNEFEYAVVNRFFITRRANELNRRRARTQRDEEPQEMETVTPGRPNRRRDRRRGDPTDPAEEAPPPGAEAAKPEAPEEPEGEVEKPSEKRPEPDPREPEGKEAPATEPAPGAESRKGKLEAGASSELVKEDVGRSGNRRQRAGRREADEAQEPGARDEDDAGGEETLAGATNLDAPSQAYELLSIKLAQKYFFDRDFGGALKEGGRNQFYPINTLSGFTYGGRARGFSPVNVQVRYRPLSTVFADLRMDVGSDDRAVRNVTLSGGVSREKFTVSTSWYLSRRIDLDPNRFEPGTFPGNQIVSTIQFGDAGDGFYGGTRIGYDFTNRFEPNDRVSSGRLRNSRSYVGYHWDCCGVQFNYNTFKAGLRNESAFSFTFTLAGLGSFGTDQFAQLGGGRGGRNRGRRARRNDFDDNF